MKRYVIVIIFNFQQQGVKEHWLHTLNEAKTEAIRVAITFRHATAFLLFSSSPNSSSKALSLFVMKPCINRTKMRKTDNGIIIKMRLTTESTGLLYTCPNHLSLVSTIFSTIATLIFLGVILLVCCIRTKYKNG